MRITLRKANAIQTAITEAIKGIEIATNININEFQNSEEVIKKNNESLLEKVQNKLQLVDALYEIRQAVGRANSQSSIDEKLTEIARLEKYIQQYTNLSTAPVREDAVVIEGKLIKIRNAKDDAHSYYRSTEVQTSVLDQQQIESFRSTVADYKKAKQRLQDEILESNIRTEIELGEDTVRVLTRERIL